MSLQTRWLLAIPAATWLAFSVSILSADVVQTPIFVSDSGGYHTYRIPSVIVLPKGTVLAFCEGRKRGRGDAGDIDLLLRRSLDGGRTWETIQVIWDDGPNTCGNPCPVIDRSTGTIWLLMTHNLGTDTEEQIASRAGRGTRTVWVSKSNDDGRSWTKPVEITQDVKRPEWTWVATGPGIGIQTSGGRLIVPCDNVVAGNRVRQSHVIVSDDHGEHWKVGGVVGPGCNEAQVVELADGQLMLNMRSTAKGHHRRIATSNDVGISWTPPTDDPTLVEPGCQASLIRHPDKSRMLLFSNPANTKRKRMTVRFSADDGRTWSGGLVLHQGPAAYSCLAILPNGKIGCLYERGDRAPYETLTFARFDAADLNAGSQPE
jgi:sialidase-1